MICVMFLDPVTFYKPSERSLLWTLIALICWKEYCNHNFKFSITQQAGRNWGEICSHEYLFDRHEKEIEILESFVTKERVAEYVKGLVGANQSTRRKLSVRVVGNDKLHVNEGQGGNSLGFSWPNIGPNIHLKRMHTRITSNFGCSGHFLGRFYYYSFHS